MLTGLLGGTPDKRDLINILLYSMWGMVYDKKGSRQFVGK